MTRSDNILKLFEAIELSSNRDPLYREIEKRLEEMDQIS
jgi:hypothetical protein